MPSLFLPCSPTDSGRSGAPGASAGDLLEWDPAGCGCACGCAREGAQVQGPGQRAESVTTPGVHR